VCTLGGICEALGNKSPDNFCRFESFDHNHRSAARGTEPRGIIGTRVREDNWRHLQQSATDVQEG